MTIKGFWYENAFHASFAPESDSSDKRDQLLVTIDNYTYECGTAEIIPIHRDSDNGVRTYLICLDSAESEVKDPTGIAFILDIESESMTFKDENGLIHVQVVAMDFDDETGQIAAIWADPTERGEVTEQEIADIIGMSDDPDDKARTTAIVDNLENLTVE